MRKWFSHIFTEVAGGVLVVIGMTIGVPFLAWLQSVPWYLVALSAIVASGATFWGMNQFATFRERHKQRFANRNDQEIEDVIHKWLDKPSLSVQREHSPNAHFQFAVRDPQGRPVVITRQKEKPSQLLLWVRLRPDEESRTKFASLQEPLKSDMIVDLRVEMARFGISFSGIAHPIQQIDLSDVVPLDDSLTDFYLQQRIMFVLRAFVLIAELIAQTLRRAEVSQSSDDKAHS